MSSMPRPTKRSGSDESLTSRPLKALKRNEAEGEESWTQTQQDAWTAYPPDSGYGASAVTGYEAPPDDDEDDEALIPRAAELFSETISAEVKGQFGEEDLSSQALKPDHVARPLWICPESRSIILEAYSPVAEQAQDFLATIAEPISRPNFIHEYKLTSHSLYAAVSVGLQTSDIIDVLNRLCKTQTIPEGIVRFIKRCTVSYGKIRLVLKENRFYVESEFPDVLQMMLKDLVIQESRAVESEKALTESTKPSKGVWKFAGEKARKKPADGTEAESEKVEGQEFIDVAGIEDAEGEVLDDDVQEKVHSFEIRAGAVQTVKKRCKEIDFPMLEEYDFRNDKNTADLDIDLKPTTMIRPYQEKSLSKMFGNGRARSGIIVLPCGAGKTLVGITATCTVKKSCLVLCTSSVSCHQWRREFLKWSNISEKQIACFTADTKRFFHGKAGIVVSTYTMVANTGKRAYDTAKIMDFMQQTEWGLLLLDEVHVVPANVFRRVLTSIAAHTKLGLTATLVREDDKIVDLNFLIGPKLYEANWMDLAQQGHIATVQCAEVWCPMTGDFYREYLKENSRKKRLLYAMNPNKFQACQYLIQYHENRGDKIIVFSDNVYALKAYALKLQKPFVYGATSHAERTVILSQFQHNPAINTIFLSKIGDTSIDLPEATCLIQVSSHYGSRRQEAQRLGRILRAKRRNQEGFNAFFYSLVSTDTEEMYYSSKRQQFLIDQGYAFKVITHLEGIENTENLVYRTKQEQLELLQSVLMANEKEADEDEVGDADYQNLTSSKANVAKRSKGHMKSLSGADNMAYIEYNRPVGQRSSNKERHGLFKQWYSGK